MAMITCIWIRRLRVLIRTLIVAAAGWTLTVALTGGVDLQLRGIGLQSTDADRPALVAILLALLYAFVDRRSFQDDAQRALGGAGRAVAWVERRAAPLALAAAVVTFVAGLALGIHVAGGSDSYGYVSQAQLWLAGDLVVEQPIARRVPWPDPVWTFTPLGYRPALEPGAIIPVYAPGLPIFMAAGQLVIGRCGPFIVVPLLAGWLVWMTYRLGRLAWSPLAGLFAALAVATSPIVVFMTLNPMSDVPSAALLVAGLAIAFSSSSFRSFGSGLVVGLAVLVRPNLAPLGAIHLACLLARTPRDEWWRTAWAFVAGAAPGVLTVAAVNTSLYGAPWNAGYGSLAALYGWGYWDENVRQYLTWLVATETPVVLLSIAAVAMLWRTDAKRRVAVRGLTASAAVVGLSYLFYTPYEVWLFLRFLLPAIPALWVLAAMAAAILLARFAGPQRAASVGLILTLVFLTYRVDYLRRERILESRAGGVTYLSAADYVRRTLPENAVIVTLLHSGSIRYYTSRLTMRWDLLPGEWWPKALDVLVEQGYRPYLLVAGSEEAQLRERFTLGEADDAPGTIVAEMTTPEPLRLYDPLRETAVSSPEAMPVVEVCPCGFGGKSDVQK